MGGLLGGGKSSKPVDPEKIRVTFEDVAGIDEVEDEIQEIASVQFWSFSPRRIPA